MNSSFNVHSFDELAKESDCIQFTFYNLSNPSITIYTQDIIGKRLISSNSGEEALVVKEKKGNKTVTTVIDWSNITVITFLKENKNED